MTEFEFIQVGALALDGIGSSAMNTVTVIFAYVIAAHFAGISLTRNTAISASIVYSLWLLAPISGMLESLNLGIRNAFAFQNSFPDSYAVNPPWSAEMIYVIALAPLVLGWIGSLVYMHRYIRKNFVNESSNDT